jgi:Ca2+-binding EF-hand superfamily protein
MFFQVRTKLLKLRVGTGLKRQFERFNTSGSGTLTLPQLKQALRHLGLDLTPTELKVLFAKVDSSGSGKITYALLSNKLEL